MCRFHGKAIMTAVVVEMKEVYILLAGLSSSPVAHYILGVSYTESCVLHLARYSSYIMQEQLFAAFLAHFVIHLMICLLLPWLHPMSSFQ